MDYLKKLKKDKNYIKILTIAFIVLLIMVMIPREKSYLSSYKIGEITRTPIIAPYDFDVLRPQNVLEKERAEAIKNVTAIFNKNNVRLPVQEKNIIYFFDLIESFNKYNSSFIANKKKKNQYKYSPDKLIAINNKIETDSIGIQKIGKEFQEEFMISIEEAPFIELYNLKSSLNFKKLEKELINTANFIYKSGVIDIAKDSIKSIQIAITENGEEMLFQKESVYDRNNAVKNASENISTKFDNLTHNQNTLISKLSALFIEPNLIYDRERTEIRQKDVLSRIPLVDEKILKNEKIVGANTRITKHIYRKLRSLNEAESTRISHADGKEKFFSILGSILIILIIYSLFLLFLFQYRIDVLKNTKLFLLLSVIQITVILFGFLIINIPFITIVLFPIIISSMLITIFFDERIAIFNSVILLLLMSFVFGNHFQFIIIHLLPAIIATFSVRNVRNRDQIFRPIGWASLGYIITIAGSYSISILTFSEILTEITFAFGNVLLSVLITYGLVHLFEKLFDITTDITLLELSDLTNPVLKELSIKAPGTFNHSLAVGGLADTVATEIGANSLLARVGSYYHDIGKIPKAEYFTENQMGDENKLNMLKPRMAKNIITNHVKAGLEIAKKNKLPKKITDFIRTHHGTMTVSYFYQKAIEKGESENIEKADFQYDGPIPFTKETGIVMIVEAIEAGVKSIEKPTQQNIEKMIDKIISQRIIEKQLDNCPLTFAEIQKLKTTVLSQLMSIYKKRISYPFDEKVEKKE